jgi:hypothetical protein
MTTGPWRGVAARVAAVVAVCVVGLALPVGSASAAPRQEATLRLKSSSSGRVLATTTVPKDLAPAIVITCYVDDTIPPFRIVDRVAFRSGIQCDAPVVGTSYALVLGRQGDDILYYVTGNVSGPLTGGAGLGPVLSDTCVSDVWLGVTSVTVTFVPGYVKSAVFPSPTVFVNCGV